MKYPLLFALCGLLTVPAWGDTPAAAPVANIAPLQPTTKTPFLSGLKEPQGMVLDKKGNIVLADYKAGEILRFSREGKKIDTVATGLKSPAMLAYDNKGNLFVTERKANRVIRIGSNGSRWTREHIEPIGIALTPYGNYVIAHTTSKIFRLDERESKLI